MKYGIICGRSWIGWAISERLSPAIEHYPKDFRPDVYEEWLQLDALFLVAGCVRPNEDEKERELSLIRRVMADVPRGLRVIYLSSSEVGRETDYGNHKLECERAIMSNIKSADWIITRPPAIYGPGQPISSEMLIPSIVRESGTVKLKTPAIFSEYCFIDDAVDHFIELAQHGFAGSYSTIRATPQQLVHLYNTWNDYRCGKMEQP